MSSNSKKILKKLSGSPAVSVEELKNNEDENTKTTYAISRALKNLVKEKCAEIYKSERQNYAKITPKGRNKLNSLILDSDTTLVNTSWDGFWRIILLDLPEERKSERESLRYLLKKAGFHCLKNSVWISPFPYEHLFTNIKKDLALTTEMMIIVTQFIDEETKKVFFETFGR